MNASCLIQRWQLHGKKTTWPFFPICETIPFECSRWVWPENIIMLDVHMKCKLKYKSILCINLHHIQLKAGPESVCSLGFRHCGRLVRRGQAGLFSVETRQKRHECKPNTDKRQQLLGGICKYIYSMKNRRAGCIQTQRRTGPNTAGLK